MAWKVVFYETEAGESPVILYFAFTGQRMVMLHAFAKKTRKTPRREIAMAEKRMDDFVRRHEP